MNDDVRPAAVAGTFYAADASRLAGDVDAMLRDAAPRALAACVSRPKALIVPHAGFVYSGPIAATAYATIASFGGSIERVVLLGPSHRVFLDGVAAPRASALETPLGRIEVDEGAVVHAHIARNELVHAHEHSLEVQLPFLQRVAPRARLVPIACGRASASEVGAVIESLWGGAETLVVVSSDLSHYLPYDEGRAADTRTAEKIVALDGELDGDEACGYVGVRGLLAVARKKRLACKLLDLRSSGDTAGPRAEVVGYGAFALTETS